MSVISWWVMCLEYKSSAPLGCHGSLVIIKPPDHLWVEAQKALNMHMQCNYEAIKIKFNNFEVKLKIDSAFKALD